MRGRTVDMFAVVRSEARLLERAPEQDLGLIGCRRLGLGLVVRCELVKVVVRELILGVHRVLSPSGTLGGHDRGVGEGRVVHVGYAREPKFAHYRWRSKKVPHRRRKAMPKGVSATHGAHSHKLLRPPGMDW